MYEANEEKHTAGPRARGKHAAELAHFVEFRRALHAFTLLDLRVGATDEEARARAAIAKATGT